VPRDTTSYLLLFLPLYDHLFNKLTPSVVSNLIVHHE
jgi:hypothetical protein